MENLMTMIVLSLDKCLKSEKQVFKYSFTLLVLSAESDILKMRAFTVPWYCRVLSAVAVLHSIRGGNLAP